MSLNIFLRPGDANDARILGGDAGYAHVFENEYLPIFKKYY